MEKAKLQIEVNYHQNMKDCVHAAIGIRGGFITKEFLLDDEVVFSGNYAFYNVLFNYYRLVGDKAGIHYDVQRASAILSFSAAKDLFVEKLNKVLNDLLNSEYNAETFEFAKQKAKEGFAAQYKDGAFRAKLKALEYADLNKRYSLKRMIDDIQTISFSDFLECAKELLVIGNICVYISGDITDAELDRLEIETDKPSCNVRIAGHHFNPLIRNDAHITNIARRNYNLNIITLDFMNPGITNFAKTLITEMVAELLGMHDSDVWVDSLDASIVVFSEQIVSYKNRLQEWNADQFDAAKHRLLSKFVIMLESMPEHYVIKAVNYMLVGVYIDQFVTYLGNLTYNMFSDICNQADYKVNEAQIILRKGSR